MNTNLYKLFANLDSKNLIFIGLGNILKGDDGVGCYIVDKLSKKIFKKNIYFINAGINIENYLNKILKLNPKRIIFVDAFKKNNSNFDFFILKKEQILNYTFSTHNISLTTLIEFLNLFFKKNFDLEFYILCVSANSLDLYNKLSKKTKKIADKLIKEIYQILNN